MRLLNESALNRNGKYNNTHHACNTLSGTTPHSSIVAVASSEL